MKLNYKLALAMLAGVGLGAAAVQALHAQAKPPAYVISEIDVTDKDAYAKEYVPLAVKALKESGQKQLAAGGRTAAFCRSLRTWTRRKQRILLRPTWKLGKSATNTRSSEYLSSKAYHRSNIRADIIEATN